MTGERLLQANRWFLFNQMEACDIYVTENLIVGIVPHMADSTPKRTVVPYRGLMRQSGTWMTVWDDRILEYISEKDTNSSSVGELTDSGSIHVSKTHVSRRSKKLAEKGFLIDLGNGVYTITEIGTAYLNGKYDAENMAYINDGEQGPTASGSRSEI